AQYRADPEACSGFGDWTPGLDGLDSYRDGQASLRMGSYIRWVYEAIKQGISKEIALEAAAEKFQRKWGTGHITEGRHH
ncbi:MAG: hypothetical protein HQ517_07455, partial [SAR324 cluster bacterium]|nr:hypothetical protein [SAR324 cluster bacterium]